MAQALRILHVDDDSEIRQIVAMSLGLDQAIEVVGAGDASEAMSQARAGFFDALLLDYTIGAADGIGLLESLRAVPGTARAPALFLTGRVRAQEHARMTAAGALSILRKPFDPLCLARDIRAPLTK